ncbi:rab-GTPase-TBC domain-containing protein [Russula vinacea]|nr:rab-GTPase-TBC domain-containing protein [Russula vinacea]
MITVSEKSHPSDDSHSLDWDALRLQSLAPGGFGGARAYIWPRLLHVDPDLDVKQSPQNFNKEHDPHQDERQIRLDTDRSFVLYPVDDSPEDVRLARQAELNKLIVKVFRRRPGLNYFQGFHDIATVLQLTLPPEKLSLHRLRDSMGHTLEPLTGLMTILQRLLRLADPPYATVLEEYSPLPYAALPHLLTLFAHATPTLPLIQHIFDYIFTRPPLIIVYLVAAVTLMRKDQVMRFCGDDDEGMIHSILTGLPTFIEYSDVHSTPGPLPGPFVATTAVYPETGDISIPSVDDPLAPPPSQPGIFISTARSASVSSGPADIPLPPSAASTPPASPTHAEPSHFQTTLSLLNVLLLADDLIVRFPPSAPDLCLARTLGSASVMRTWAEESALLPSDDQAEALVVAGIDIVVREVEPASLTKVPRQSARRGETRLLVVGAVLVLGAAVAIGVSSRGGGSGEADWSALFDTLGTVGEMLGRFGDVQLGL